MIEIKQPGAYYVAVSINHVDIKADELRYVLVEFELGNIMSKLVLNIMTNRNEVIQNSLVEMSIIDVEIGITDENNDIINKKVCRYFLAKTQINQQQNMMKSGDCDITLIGITDAYKYLGKPQTRGSDKGTVSNFLSKISGVGSGERGTGTIKLEVKDNLTETAQDKQKWIQNDQTGIETVNSLLLRSLKTPESGNPRGKYHTNANEWVYTACVDFKDDGIPVLYIYDLKLRSLSFSPKTFKDGREAKFSYKEDSGEFIPYRDIKLDIKGADYSAAYWQRVSFAFDIEENTTWYRHTRHPYLFSDSAPYTDQMDFDGNDGIPDEMPIFRSTERMNLQNYTTNTYSRYFVDQKVQTPATMMSLRKINVKMTFPHDFFDIAPIDICKVQYELGKQDEESVPNPKLSGNYMVTACAFEFDGVSTNTYVTASRDSWVKG